MVQQDPSICWDCANACGGCTWSDRLVPVGGWKAIETVDASGDPGFRVQKCPEFIRDKGGRPELDDQGCVEMIEKLLELTRIDYILGNKNTEEEIERFLRGRGASKVHRINNPEEAIRNLKEAKKEYWEAKRNEQADNHRKSYSRS